MKKISNKIILSIILCVTVFSTLIGIISIVRASKIIKKEAVLRLKLIAENHTTILNEAITSVETTCKSLNSTVTATVNVDTLKSNAKATEDALLPILQNCNHKDSVFIASYVVFTPELTGNLSEIFFADKNRSGEFIRMPNDSVSDFSPSNPNMLWYFEPIKAKKGIWSLPFLDPKTNIMTISYSEPIYKDDRIIGVCGINIDYNKYKELINSISVYKTGYAFLLNDKFNYLIHKDFNPKDNLLLTDDGKYTYIKDQMLSTTSGIVYTVYKNNEKLIAYSKLSNGWIVCISALQKEALNGIYDVALLIVLIVLIGIITSAIIAFKVGKKISTPVVKATKFAEKLSKGNLYGYLEVATKDETKLLSESLNLASENISNLIEELKATEDELIDQIAELKKSEETVRKLAFTNQITSLPNRNALYDQIPLILSKDNNFLHLKALLYVDIDNFKMLNDTLGHTLGDKFLYKLSEIFSTYLGENDYLYNIGGDEFAFFLSSVNHLDEVKKFAQTIIDVFIEPLRVCEHEISFLTASIGIVIYPVHGNDIETLLKRADAALSKAKSSGKNRYEFFTDALNFNILERINLEKNLRHALMNNELILYYQPKIDVKTGEVVSVEALLRWVSPTLGFVSPLKFITLAEETGLIVPIGEYVLRTACNQNKIWKEKGLPPIRIAVNLSPKQIQDEGLIKIISDTLVDTALDPSYLEIEITESVLMNNFDNCIKVLTDLQNMGIKVSLDDFGTGYSSLNYLRRLPINTIKIDKSFVDGLTINPKDSFIASSLINLAHGMCLTVVAEGVETEDQYNLLRDYSCDEIQGFYFSKPLPAMDLECLLEK